MGKKAMENGNRGRILKALRILSLGVLTVCLFQLARVQIQSAEQRSRQQELKLLREAQSVDFWDGELAAQAEQEPSPGENEGDAASGQTEAFLPEPPAAVPTPSPTPVMLDKYRLLYEKNQDLAGWITIEDTVIDYPVMQCSDEEYYLHHDFDGKDSKYGCLFVKDIADLEEGDNFIIYGHNMKDGAMFGSLDEYRSKEFWKSHSEIIFDTLYTEHRYEILAVFLSQVYSAEEEGFRYYRFYEAQSQEEFDDFYENVKALSLYDTGVTARYGDCLLTLSTCAYHVKDGRLVVVAKRTD